MYYHVIGKTILPEYATKRELTLSIHTSDKDPESIPHSIATCEAPSTIIPPQQVLVVPEPLSSTQDVGPLVPD